MKVIAIRRYPVKSMLGEDLEHAVLTATGIEHDREFALIDTETGMVATAKQPRYWRDLLLYSAAVRDGRAVMTSPAGYELEVGSAEADAELSSALGRSVRMASERPAGGSVERPAPEDVLDHGLDAEVDAQTLEIGQGTTGTNFVDYAPVHLITTATLEAIGTEMDRYRPNLVLETPHGTRPFIENDWPGRELRISSRGCTTVLTGLIPTPRCAVPTLQHGELPRAPHATRKLIADNLVDVPGFGTLPCAGVYAGVVTPGTVHHSATVEVL
ncbi:MOSC N-terminal beta barrel domain-containing protein [Pseudonocardia sp. C8]|uniref:MOSC domain-containing protein n=1 Tax=Pseudonocardia sp. C8 TaxID=2762759 RepID=UPI0016432F20|nr:MOSC N-terminal beta barrel domain-containing protein [Pseudonocardia sp. C8]